MYYFFSIPCRKLV